MTQKPKGMLSDLNSNLCILKLMKRFTTRDGKCIYRHLLRILGPNIVFY
jgi:hypothetical protein